MRFFYFSLFLHYRKSILSVSMSNMVSFHVYHVDFTFPQVLFMVTQIVRYIHYLWVLFQGRERRLRQSPDVWQAPNHSSLRQLYLFMYYIGGISIAQMFMLVANNIKNLNLNKKVRLLGEKKPSAPAVSQWVVLQLDEHLLLVCFRDFVLRIFFFSLFFT